MNALHVKRECEMGDNNESSPPIFYRYHRRHDLMYRTLTMLPLEVNKEDRYWEKHSILVVTFL